MTITFTPPPTLPSLSDPANFNDRALGLFGWLTGTFIPELEGVEGLVPDGGDFNVDAGTFFVDVSTNRVGIGTTTPATELEVAGASEIVRLTAPDAASNFLSFYDSTARKGYVGYGDGTENLRIDAESTGGQILLRTNGNTRITVANDGDVGIGTGSPLAKLHSYQTGSQYAAMLESNQTNTTMTFSSTGSVNKFYQGISTGDGTDMRIFAGNTTRMTVTSAGDVGIGTTMPSEKLDVVGNVTISGSLSKGSGSFKIDHPLKPETHHLVHSFVESPQADNIYRGTVSLVGGQATVNLDTAGRMSEGTFVALNGNVQCFTSNEDGWTAVRGSVSGNILTIEAQDNTCTDTVSWMVVGERIDQHMIDASWTDDNGRVITEPLKPETPE